MLFLGHKSRRSRYQALPGNADPEALPPIFMEAWKLGSLRGRASGHRFPGRA
jgi:hypothetical protein